MAQKAKVTMAVRVVIDMEVEVPDDFDFQTEDVEAVLDYLPRNWWKRPATGTFTRGDDDDPELLGVEGI